MVIIYEWLRDSFIGFVLIVSGMVAAGLICQAIGVDELYLPLLVIGAIPFLWFANRREVIPVTRSDMILLLFLVSLFSLAEFAWPQAMKDPRLLAILPVAFLTAKRLVEYYRTKKVDSCPTA